jgi:hypothetical protein
MLIAAWIFVAFLLGLWSLALWGVHALLTFDPSSLSDLKPLIDQIPYGAVIDRWVPGWQDLLRLAIDLTQRGIAWLGDLAPAIVWTVWGFGALALLGLGGLLTLLVRWVRRSAAPARPAVA